MVFGASCFGHEALGQFLQVSRIFHLDLRLLPEEVLEVLQQLDPHVCLLVQTFLLLHQLGPDLYRGRSTGQDMVRIYSLCKGLAAAATRGESTT